MEIRCKYCGKSFDSENLFYKTEGNEYTFTCPSCRKINDIMENKRCKRLYYILLFLYIMCVYYFSICAIWCIFDRGGSYKFFYFALVIYFIKKWQNRKVETETDWGKILSESVLIWFILNEAHFLRSFISSFSLENLAFALICAIVILVAYCNMGKVRNCLFLTAVISYLIIGIYKFGSLYLFVLGGLFMYIIALYLCCCTKRIICAYYNKTA